MQKERFEQPQSQIRLQGGPDAARRECGSHTRAGLSLTVVPEISAGHLFKRRGMKNCVSICLAIAQLSALHTRLVSSSIAEKKPVSGSRWASELQRSENVHYDGKAALSQAIHSPRKGSPAMARQRAEMAVQTGVRPDGSTTEHQRTSNKATGHLPQDFDWRTYLSINKDLGEHGFNTEIKAKQHYLQHGGKESRVYKPFKVRMHYTACTGEKHQFIASIA